MKYGWHAALQAFIGCLALASSGNSSAQPGHSSEPLVREQAPVELKVGEGFVTPLGYFESKPRFSWQTSPDSDSRFQVAFHVQVASHPAAFEPTADLWDSGKVDSAESSWIRYRGEPLKSRQRVYWRVRTWDEKGHASPWSDTAALELGLLENQDWQGQWIGHPDTRTDRRASQQVLATPQYLRRTFAVRGEVERARLYITARGLTKPYLNGAAVSASDVMTPGWTPYARRIETLTYDVTGQLAAGPNTIAASLAGGWYSGRVFDQHEKDHRLPPRLLAQLEIRYRDGRTQTIVTDENWRATQQGPIRFASIYDGERYEQALEMPGWATVEFDDSSWKPAITEPLDVSVALRPKRHRPIRRMKEVAAQNIERVGEGVAIFDMGQNLTGVPRIRLPAKEKQEIRLRFAEALHQGSFYTDNYRSAKSTDYYLPARTEIIEYEPTFTYHGFRYIEVTGFDASKTPSKDWVTAVVQHSDVELYLDFDSSHAKLNQLFRNINWGLRSNFYDIPLDCPQRDERLGWTGDAQVFVTPSMYLADVYGFWAAWLQSMREEQTAEGKIPVYIPFVEHINWASSGWGDAATIIPWELYQLTGDEAILADNYEMMNRWVDYHQSQSEDYLSGMQTFGDWLQPYPETKGKPDNRGDTDFKLISTAYFARSVEMTRNAARVLGRQVDAERLDGLHTQLKHAFRNRFFDARLLPVASRPTQTSYLLGLGFGLFEPEEIPLARNILIGLIADADQHLRTGFLGTPLLAPVLQDAGRSDLAYELLFRESYPSWFHSINHGATTTWERWDSYSLETGFNPQGMNSLNHYAYGSISRWFYEGILGITPAEPGFRRIHIEPQIGRELSWAKGGYQTPEGEVHVAWKVSSGHLEMSVVVPKNTVADVLLSSAQVDGLRIDGSAQETGSVVRLGPGHHDVTARMKQVSEIQQEK